MRWKIARKKPEKGSAGRKESGGVGGPEAQVNVRRVGSTELVLLDHQEEEDGGVHWNCQDGCCR